MQDLSHLAADAPWISAMECGNMTHGNDGALAGPGTEPVTPMPAADKQVNPHVTPVDKPLSVAEHGSGGYTPSPLSWKKTVNG